MAVGILILLIAWLLAVLGTFVNAARHSYRRPRGPTPQSAVADAVAKLGTRVFLVRPCAGLELHLVDNLLSAAAMGAAQLSGVWLLVEEGDPAQAVVQGAAAALRQKGINATCLLTHPTGANHKACQLAEAAALSGPGDIWFCVDSDVDLSTFDAAAMLLSLEGAHAAWAPWCEGAHRPCSIGDRISEAVLNGSLHAFPLLCGIAPWGLVGKVMAIRFDALQTMGGWNRFINYLGEDFELGQKLRATGHRLALAPVTARAHATGRFLERIEQRFLRWYLVVRGQRPIIMLTYPLLFFYTVPLCLSALVLGWFAPQWEAASHGLIAATLATRLLTAVVARRRCGNSHNLVRVLLDVTLGDFLLGYTWLLALKSRRVAWRGRRLVVERGGVLRPEP